MKLLRKVTSMLSFLFRTPVIEQDYLARTEAFLADMRAQTNPRDLYRWARDQINEAGGQHAEVSYVPGFVGWTSSRMPTIGYVERSGDTPYVHLIWSRAGDRWGLKIGPADFAPTPDPADHHVEWAPGIYAWHEIKADN